MHELKTVIKFEYATLIKNKAFLVTSVLFFIIISGLAFIPQIVGLFTGSDNSNEPNQTGDVTKAVIIDINNTYSDEILKAYGQQYEWIRESISNLDAVNKGIENDEYVLAIVIDGMDMKMYSKTTSFNAFGAQDIFTQMIIDNYRFNEFDKLGISAEDVNVILNKVPSTEMVSVGKDITQTFGLAYAILMMLYMAIIMYGNLVMTSVVTEKSSKAMELLITSVKPIYLIFGKVIGVGLAGLTQFGLIICMAIGLLKLNSGAWEEFFPLVVIMVDMALSSNLLIYALIFFILGFFFYAFLYAGFASTVSRMEDASSVVMIPMFMFIAAFMVAMSGLATPEATYVKVCSFIPFFTPMVMFMRICVTTVPAWEIFLSIAITFIGVIIVGYVGAKIYRVGVLMYGNSPKLKDIIKYARQK